jgi:hypothetical protein
MRGTSRHRTELLERTWTGPGDTPGLVRFAVRLRRRASGPRVAVRVAPWSGDTWRVKQVLDLTHARDFACGALDPADLLRVLELSAEHDDPAVGVDADLPLGDCPVSEQLALDLADQTDVVELAGVAMAAGDRVRESDHLARLVVGVAFELPCAATQRASCAVAQQLSPSAAVAGIEEELKRRTGRERRRRDCEKPGR